MATTGLIQRRDIKSALIAGQPSTGSGGDWSGPVIYGEIVFATDTKEFGFLDASGNLKWVSVEDIGSGAPTDGVPIGGDTGQVLTKLSDIDRDVNWQDLNFVKDGDGYRIKDRSSDVLGEGAVNLSFGGSATGRYSHAEGYNVTASGYRSHAEGRETHASGHDSHAEGYYTTASGYYSHAEGYRAVASGHDSHAEGRETTATGEHSHAEGHEATASGLYSHVEGFRTVASGLSSHAEGYNVTASGYFSHAEGYYTVASHNCSHAGGKHTVAGYDSQTAIGKYNENKSDTLFEVGNGSDSTRSNALEIYSDGRIHAPSLHTNQITDGRCLVTREYLSTQSNITVLSTLPAASLGYFKTICYAIDSGSVNICVSNSETPSSNSDCFWIQI